MNFCSQCGNALPLNSKFCPHCGEKIVLVELGNSKSSWQYTNSEKENIDNSSPKNDLIGEKRSGKIDFSDKDNFIICNDNLRYFGEFKNNQRDGFGVYFAYNSGDNFLKEYEGEWERNFFKGQGIQYHHPGYILREGYFDQRENYFKGKYNSPLFAQGAEVIGVRVNYEGEMRVDSDIRNSIVTKPYNEYVAKEDFIGAYYCISSSMLPNGYGISYYEDGTIEYQGYWKNGKPNGQGLYHYFDEKKGGSITSFDWLDSSLIEGEFQEGILVGPGKVITDDGTVYEGVFIDGNLNGEGKISSPAGIIFEGVFVDDSLNGKGKVITPYGWFSEGDFVDDKLNGKGKRIYDNGIVYEGDFVDNNLNGKGKITSPDGLIIEGDFIDDNLNGNGKKIFADGTCQEGNFIDNKLNGKGKLTNIEGSYEGNWELNLPKGDFVFTNKEGNKINGYFKIAENNSLTFVSNTSTGSPIPPRDGAGLR